MRTFASGIAAAALAAWIATIQSGNAASADAPPPSVLEGPQVSAPVEISAGIFDDSRRLNQQFLGTWHLTGLSVATEDGKRRYPLGENAEGLLMYAADGRMAVSIWKPNRRPFAAADQQRGTPAEYAAAVRSFVQYMGTFTVDRKQRTVSHRVAQSVFPNWNGTTQTRFYEFKNHGRQLTLTTPPVTFGGIRAVYTVDWRR